MYYNISEKQWITDGTDNVLWGIDFVKELIRKHEVNVLEAGTLLIFRTTWCYLGFQTLQDIDLTKAYGNMLIGYEPGSVCSLQGEQPSFVPTFKLNKLRLPNHNDFKLYDERCNL